MSTRAHVPTGSPGQSKLAYRTAREIEKHLKETLKDRILHLSIVAHGRQPYREAMREAFGGYAIDDHLIDACFDFLAARSGSRPAAQRLDWLMRWES